MLPLIGQIVRDLTRSLPKQATGTASAPDRNLVYADFDRRFGGRADYRLWRCAVVPRHARRGNLSLDSHTPLSAIWADWHVQARLGAEAADPEVFWSTIALAPELIQAIVERKQELEFQRLLKIAVHLHERLTSEIEPLASCSASCGIAAAIFTMQYFLLRQHTPQGVTPIEVEQCLEELRRWFKHADPNWDPPRKVNTAQVQRERKGESRLRPNQDIYEFDALTRTLSAVPSFVWKNMPILDSRSIVLRRTSCGFAYSAWRTMRSRRIWETEFQRKNGLTSTRQSKQARRAAFLREFESVRSLSTALRDAENYLESAKVMYLLLRVIPDELVDDPEILDRLRRRWVYFLHMKEAGLEVDNRFSDIEQFAAEQELFEEHPEGEPVPPNIQGFHQVLERDQRSYTAWNVILDDIPGRPKERLKAYLRRAMRTLAIGEHVHSPELLQAGYALARRYGYIRSAGQILHRAVHLNAFELNKKHIIDFVHCVRRCMSLDPFGMHFPTAVEWQNLTLDACAKLYDQHRGENGWFSPTEKLWIHETLIGRTHTHHRSLSYDSASRLYRKAAGIYSITDLRNFYDREYDFLTRPFGVATSDKIAEYCASHKNSTLGAPVFVSMLCMRTVLSLAIVDKYRSVLSAEIRAANLLEELDNLSVQADFWFKATDVPFREQIEWPNTLKQVGHAILDLASRCDGSARVLILSVEPELAHLPWQHLISACATERTNSEHVAAPSYLVSLVPNASTITVNKPGRDGLQRGLQTTISTDTDDAISQVVQAIDRTVLAGAVYTSTRIVLGHGQAANGSPLPLISLGDGRRLQTIEEWMEIVRSRHVVLHCCHSGRTEPIFMRELGGLPGIALALGTTVLLAPASEVAASSAVALQESLFEGTSSIGEAYVKAIARDPGACLYNCFGDPYESLTGANGVRSPEMTSRALQ
jgi:hypothetical protein